MIIKICFPFYKECPIYDKLINEGSNYRGNHRIIFKKAQGTIVHDVRNILVAGTLKINNKWKLPEFDYVVMIDSDIDCSLSDIIYMCETGKDIIGLPYVLRGCNNLYNAGYIQESEIKHIPVNTKGLREVDGQGNGCKAISRRVFERLEHYWFWPMKYRYKDGSIESLVEDWAFDYKARQKGFKVWCDFNKPVNHNIKGVKTMELHKSQIQARSLLDNVYKYINDLCSIIEKMQLENTSLKKELESFKGVSTKKVSGNPVKGKPPK